MRQALIIGTGQTKIGEWWERNLADLAVEALKKAMDDAGLEGAPDTLVVGNMLAGQLSRQQHLGSLVATAAGWKGIDAITTEAACGSGGAAVMTGVRAVLSGAADVAIALGLEKMTDGVQGARITAGLATAADAEVEVDQGIHFVSLNALVMQRYMHEYKIPHEHFAPFPLNAHKNASYNPNAMYQKAITEEMYHKAPVISPPIGLYDSSPICDGAAAVVIASDEVLGSLSGTKAVRVLASISATDTITLQARRNLIELDGAMISAQKAYELSGMGPIDIDLFELHDAFSIMSTLSLEAAGFAKKGQGTRLALEGEIRPEGRIPISTMGGLKARGHPVGASGVYQVVDAITQLRGEAGANQVPNAEIAMTQNVGGSGATVVTHILRRER